MTRWIVATLVGCACAGGDSQVGDAGESSTSGTAGSTTDDGETSGSVGEDGTSGFTSSGEASSTDTGDPEGPPTLQRIGDTFTIPSLEASAPKRFADAAHDPVGDVYLVVNGNGATSGSFVDAEGTPVGMPFAVAQTQAYTQGVRVGFGGDAFLVAWHDNRERPNSARVRGRLVRWDGSAPTFGGDDFAIGTSASYSEMPPALAWSETSGRWLVAWHTSVADDIHAQFVGADGTLVGAEIVVTADPDWQSDVGLAWNPERDEWLAAYTHAGATTEVRARRVALDGALLGNETSLTQAGGTWLAHAAWEPDRGEYVVAWFESRIAMRRVDADGNPIGDVVELATGYGNYDGFSMAYSPVTRTFAAVFHGQSDEDFAATFDADGTQSAVIEATSSRGMDGHFNPHVAAHSTRPEWLLVTSLGFASIVGQRLGP
jgi:hypothetical protein